MLFYALLACFSFYREHNAQTGIFFSGENWPRLFRGLLALVWGLVRARFLLLAINNPFYLSVHPILGRSYLVYTRTMAAHTLTLKQHRERKKQPYALTLTLPFCGGQIRSRTHTQTHTHTHTFRNEKKNKRDAARTLPPAGGVGGKPFSTGWKKGVGWRGPLLVRRSELDASERTPSASYPAHRPISPDECITATRFPGKTEPKRWKTILQRTGHSFPPVAR